MINGRNLAVIEVQSCPGIYRCQKGTIISQNKSVKSVPNAAGRRNYVVIIIENGRYRIARYGNGLVGRLRADKIAKRKILGPAVRPVRIIRDRNTSRSTPRR